MSFIKSLLKDRLKIILICLIFFGFFIRVVGINSSPPSMYGDELTIVYDAYSILTTAHDQTGKLLPLTFAMGAGRPGGYVYASVPFVAVFGMTPIGVRGVSILSGVLLILLMYWLGKVLFSPQVGLIAAALMTISPWDLSLSRGGFEAHFALMMAVLGTGLLITFKENPWRLVWAAVCFSLAIHTYPIYKLLLPIDILIIVWFLGGFKVFVGREYRKQLLISLGIILITGSLSVIQTVWNGSEQRFSNINAFTQLENTASLIQKINYERDLDKAPLFLPVVLHNRPLEMVLAIGRSYLDNFSTKYLFYEGDGNPRHNMASTGTFYLIDLFLIILGIGYLFRNYGLKKFMFIGGWMLIAPIPAALLLELHVLRSSFLLPPILLLSALGFYHLWTISGRKITRIIKYLVLTAFAIQFIFIVARIFYLSPFQYSSFWSYPAKLAAETAIGSSLDYQSIFLSDKIENVEYAYQVINKIPANDVVFAHLNQVKIGDFSFRKYGNVYIGGVPDTRIADFVSSQPGKVIYLGSIFEKDKWLKYDVMVGLDNKPAFIKVVKND